jgi:hypothetical protein
MSKYYVEAFNKLNCSEDILNVVEPVQRLTKEISEVWTIVRALRKILPFNDHHLYKVLDLCAGNGLLGVTLAHLFKFDHVTSLDTRVPKRNWNSVKRFSYYNTDVSTLTEPDIKGKIIVASHPCKNAAAITQLFGNYGGKALVLLPCCKGQLKPRPKFVLEKFGKYGSWCMDQYDFIANHSRMNGYNIKVNIYEDKGCLSPRNIVITAVRK